MIPKLMTNTFAAATAATATDLCVSMITVVFVLLICRISISKFWFKDDFPHRLNY